MEELGAPKPHHAILYTSTYYGIRTGMDDVRKITVHVSEDLLTEAQAETGQGVTETVRAGLQLLRQRRAMQKALALQGKLKFSVDLMALRREED